MKVLNLREKRIEKNWTLEYVGQQLGIAKNTVHDLETGKSKPSYDVLCKLEKLFNKKHNYLFAVSNQDTPIKQHKNTTGDGRK